MIFARTRRAMHQATHFMADCLLFVFFVELGLTAFFILLMLLA